MFDSAKCVLYYEWETESSKVIDAISLRAHSHFSGAYIIAKR